MRCALWFTACWIAVAGTALRADAGEAKRPAVLFTSSLHTRYFAKPLHAEGIEFQTCSLDQLPALLASGKYNVVVVTGGLTDPKVVEALKGFLNAGGGILLYPGARWEEDDYIARQKFLEGYGAHWTMTLIREKDKDKTVRAMFTDLFFTDTIPTPFNDGVAGVLYLGGGSQSGMTSPVSVVGDGNWRPVVKASATAQAEPWTEERIVRILPYVPKEAEAAPSLLSVREAGGGRLAAIGIGAEWMFQAPTNCPPVEDMMTRGRGGKPSHWVKLLANVFRWLAEPTLKAGKGGEPTPLSLLEAKPVGVSFEGWAGEMLKPRDWTKAPPIEDQSQLMGLIGARSSYSGGKATVEEWVKAARAAGLNYLVFLEPLEFTTEEKYNKLKADCEKFSDDAFFACPGIWSSDLYTKTAMFNYGLNSQYPLRALLTADGKCFDNSAGMPKQMRTKYIFDYCFEQLGYKGQFGFFRHKENVIPVWEYKMNNVFPVFSTENGKPLDDAFEEFQYLQATDFCYHPAAFSLMDDPGQIARAMKEDWVTVNVAPGEFGDGTYTAEYGQGVAAMKKLFSESVAWVRPFQYITQGPRLNCWRGRWEIVIPFGEWYRPDHWRYRVRLHATSGAGIKEVQLFSAGKVLYRFLPNGAKEFDRTFEFENSQQRAMYPVVTDVNGKRAIGSYIRNSNTLWNEFICGDRCNFLAYGIIRIGDGRLLQVKPSGNAVTHNKGAWMAELTPSVTLTVDYPTMPIDGAPHGEKTPGFSMFPGISTPGYPEIAHINCKPQWVLSSPDVLIGGGRPDNVIVDKDSWGNAWSWWSPVKPNEFIEGYGLHTAFAPYPEGLRAGWYEFRLTARKDLPLTEQPGNLPVRFTYTVWTEVRDGDGKTYRVTDEGLPQTQTGSFKKGAYVLVEEPGGPAGLVSMDDNLVYLLRGKEVQIGLKPGAAIAKGAAIACRIGYLGAPGGTDLEVMRRYLALMGGQLPVKVSRGRVTGDFIAARIDCGGADVDLQFEPLAIRGYLPIVLENVQKNWDVWLVDRTLRTPNWRQLPKTDDTAYAVLPCDTKKDYFLGHPVVADNKDLVINLCNLLPGQWQVSLHNPTDKPIAAKVRSASKWPVFVLKEKQYTIPAGSSVDVEVRAP